MKSLIKTDINSKLLNDIKKLIEESKNFVAVSVNASMTMLFWDIGKRVNQNILVSKRAKYGKQIVVTLSRQLVQEYGNCFEEKNLRRMVQFAFIFPDEEIVATLSQHLSWSHFVALIPLKQPLQREFYAEICRTFYHGEKVDQDIFRFYSFQKN